MGLHQAITQHNRIRIDVGASNNNYTFADEDEEEFDGGCPECDARTYQCDFYGRYSQVGYFTIGQSRYIDYDGMETEGTDDSGNWECENGHLVRDLDILERLEQA